MSHITTVTCDQCMKPIAPMEALKPSPYLRIRVAYRATGDGPYDCDYEDFLDFCDHHCASAHILGAYA